MRPYEVIGCTVEIDINLDTTPETHEIFSGLQLILSDDGGTTKYPLTDWTTASQPRTDCQTYSITSDVVQVRVAHEEPDVQYQEIVTLVQIEMADGSIIDIGNFLNIGAGADDWLDPDLDLMPVEIEALDPTGQQFLWGFQVTRLNPTQVDKFGFIYSHNCDCNYAKIGSRVPVQIGIPPLEINVGEPPVTALYKPWQQTTNQICGCPDFCGWVEYIVGDSDVADVGPINTPPTDPNANPDFTFFSLTMEAPVVELIGSHSVPISFKLPAPYEHVNLRTIYAPVKVGTCKPSYMRPTPYANHAGKTYDYTVYHDTFLYVPIEYEIDLPCAFQFTFGANQFYWPNYPAEYNFELDIEAFWKAEQITVPVTPCGPALAGGPSYCKDPLNGGPDETTLLGRDVYGVPVYETYSDTTSCEMTPKNVYYQFLTRDKKGMHYMDHIAECCTLTPDLKAEPMGLKNTNMNYWINVIDPCETTNLWMINTEIQKNVYGFVLGGPVELTLEQYNCDDIVPNTDICVNTWCGARTYEVIDLNTGPNPAVITSLIVDDASPTPVVITADSLDLADQGDYKFKVIVRLAEYPEADFPDLKNETTYTITIGECTLTSFSTNFTTVDAEKDFFYMLTYDQQTLPVFYFQDPDCQYNPSITVTVTDWDTGAPVTFSGADPITFEKREMPDEDFIDFYWYSEDRSHVGAYKVSVHAQLGDSLSTFNDEVWFKLTIYDRCADEGDFAPEPQNDMFTTVRLGYADAPPQKEFVKEFMDTVTLALRLETPAPLNMEKVYCGPRLYEFVSVTSQSTGLPVTAVGPGDYGMISITQDTDPHPTTELLSSILIAMTDDPLHEGSYDVVIRGSMVNYPEWGSHETAFVVDVGHCVVVSVPMDPLGPFYYKVFDPEDSAVFTFNQQPNCEDPMTYSFSYSQDMGPNLLWMTESERRMHWYTLIAKYGDREFDVFVNGETHHGFQFQGTFKLITEGVCLDSWYHGQDPKFEKPINTFPFIESTLHFDIFKDEVSVQKGKGSGYDLCGPQTYSVHFADNDEEVPTSLMFANRESTLVAVMITDPHFLGEHQVYLKVNMEWFPSVEHKQYFTVFVNPCYVVNYKENPVQPIQRYTIGEPAHVFEWGFQQTPSCDYDEKITMYLNDTEIDLGDSRRLFGKEPWPEFITLDLEKRTFSIQSELRDHAGTHWIRIDSKLNDEKVTKASQTIQLECFYFEDIVDANPLYFEHDLEKQYITVGKDWFYFLPPVRDKQQDDIYFNVTVPESMPFLHWDVRDTKFSAVGSTVLDHHIGEYTVFIQLMSGERPFPKKVNLVQLIEVIPAPLQIGSEGGEELEEREEIKYIWGDPKLRINKVLPDGQVQIKWLTEMYLPEDICQRIDNRRNRTSFEEMIMVVDVIPSVESEREDLEFEWEMISCTNYSMWFQLDFKTPLYVSSKSERDMVQVTLWNTTKIRYLMEEGDLSYLAYELRVIQREDYQGIVTPGDSLCIDRFLPKTRMRHEIPPQYVKTDSDDEWDAWDWLEVVTFSITAFVIVENLILNLLLGILLQSLWGMIHVLQLVVHMALINLLYPANIHKVLCTFMLIASFEVYDTSEWFEDNFNLTHTEAVNLNLEMLGYEARSFIINAGMLFCVVAVNMTILFLIAGTYILQRKYPWWEKVYKYLRDHLVWNFFIRIFYESYIEICVAAIIQMTHFEINTFGDANSFAMGFMMIQLVVFAPFLILMFLSNHYDKLDVPVFQNKFGAIYTGLRHDESIPLVYPFIFQARRLLLAIVVLFMGDWPYFQLQFCLQSQIFVLIYIGWVKPFGDIVHNIQETTNEIFVIFFCYHMLLFTEFIDNPETRHAIGFSAQLVFCILLFFNIGICFFTQIRAIRRLWLERKRNKALLQAEIKEEVKSQRLLKKLKKRNKLEKSLNKMTVEQMADQIMTNLVTENKKPLDEIKEEDSFPEPVKSEDAELRSPPRLLNQAQPPVASISTQHTPERLGESPQKNPYRRSEMFNFQEIENLAQLNQSRGENQSNLEVDKLARIDDGSMNLNNALKIEPSANVSQKSARMEELPKKQVITKAAMTSHFSGSNSGFVKGKNEELWNMDQLGRKTADGGFHQPKDLFGTNEADIDEVAAELEKQSIEPNVSQKRNQSKKEVKHKNFVKRLI